MSLIRKAQKQWDKMQEMRTVQKERLETCKKCKFFNEEFGTCGKPFPAKEEVTYYGKKYKLCGCIMKVKSKLAFASCPVGKWEAFTGFADEHYDKVKTALDNYEKERTKDNLREVNIVYKEILGSAGHHIDINSSCGSCRENRLKDLREYVKRMEKC